MVGFLASCLRSGLFPQSHPEAPQKHMSKGRINVQMRRTELEFDNKCARRCVNIFKGVGRMAGEHPLRSARCGACYNTHGGL